MTDVLLIDAERVRKYGYAHTNVLPDLITTTIRRVQQVMLKRVLGREVYADLLNLVVNANPPTPVIVPLAPATTTLLNEYIQPYLIACVDLRLVAPLTTELRSKSAGSGTDANHNAATIAEMVRLQDQFRQDVEAYHEDLVNYLKPKCVVGESTGSTFGNSIKFR